MFAIIFWIAFWLFCAAAANKLIETVHGEPLVNGADGVEVIVMIIAWPLLLILFLIGTLLMLLGPHRIGSLFSGKASGKNLAIVAVVLIIFGTSLHRLGLL